MVICWAQEARDCRGALCADGLADKIAAVSMRIAFYAPLKAPTHPVPSGDRRVAGLLLQALEQAGCEVELASELRSYEGRGEAHQQIQIRQQGQREAARLIERWQAKPVGERPQLWFTYHLYYKAPDWIGPLVCAELGIPYVLCEASFAPKRASGPWSMGHDAVALAIARAALVLAPTPGDMACVQAVAGPHTQIARLPPFLDAAPFAAARRSRDQARASLAATQGLDPGQPWLLAVGMMRQGDKLASYLELAKALERVADLPWQLLLVGDGAARSQVQAAFEWAQPQRVYFLGQREVEDMPGIYASADLCVWPAVNEAYGMALLEAQAAGLPVVAGETRGVPEVVCKDQTALLTPTGDTTAFAAAVRALLSEPAKLKAMGEAASAFVAGQRSLAQASMALAAHLGDVLARHAACRAEGTRT